MIGVVIPAHDEARVLGRLLSALTRTGEPARPETSSTGVSRSLDIVVVANGCGDDTDQVAAAFEGVKILVTPVAGKAGALRLGDSATDAFPRVYIDADVEIGFNDVQRLATALDEPGVLIASPTRTTAMTGVNWAVRLYYLVWQELPAVRTAAFGRGVVALSQLGHTRVAALPSLMADDLAMAAVFEDSEQRLVSDAVVVVHPPRTWADLVRRRVRAVTGTAQVYDGTLHTVKDSRTTPVDLLSVVRRRPAALAGVPVFLLVTLVARHRAHSAIRRGDFITWLRDDSSRS